MEMTLVVARHHSYGAACENLPLSEWVAERYENCVRLAETKTGLDRDRWLNDAEYFREISVVLSSKNAKKLDTGEAEHAPRLLTDKEITALRQMLDYAQAEHRKSQQGYFSESGWAGGTLKALLDRAEHAPRQSKDKE